MTNGFLNWILFIYTEYRNMIYNWIICIAYNITIECIQAIESTAARWWRTAPADGFQMGHYWGSIPDSSESAATVVPVGTASSSPKPKSIVPLSRPSGSRVSRILEGSMDAAT